MHAMLFQKGWREEAMGYGEEAGASSNDVMSIWWSLYVIIAMILYIAGA